MSYLRFFAALLLACSPALADFTFIHASDPHFGSGTNHETNTKLFAEIRDLPSKPAFVITTGDIAEYGTDAEYAELTAALPALGDVKFYPAPGNHDVRWNPRGKEGYTLGTGAPLYRSWDHENVHFITLDSTVLLEHWGHISREQLNWLAEDLKKVGPDKPVIIGFHHWIGRESIQTDNEQQLLSVVAPYNVVLWLQGHGHSDIEWNVNGTPAMMVKGLYQGSYNIIEVTDTELKVTKRYLPSGTKPTTQELTRDKSAPPDTIQPATRPLLTIPLKKRPAPDIKIETLRATDAVAFKVQAPENSSLTYRLNTEPSQPLTPDTQIPLKDLTPGHHTVTLTTTLPDGRAYQTPVPVIAPGITPTWQADLGAEVQSRLVRSGDKLYCSTMGTDLVALNAATGKEVFRLGTGGPIFSSAHVTKEALYVGSADHHLYAIHPDTGAQLWKTELGGAVLAGPNETQGVVCVGTTDTKIYGLSATTGQILWTVQGGNMFQSVPAADADTFYVGGWDNHFRAIDAKTGTLKWDLILGKKQNYKTFSAFAPAIAAPTVADGRVFISTNDGILHALNTADGKELWQIDWKKMGYSSPLFANGKVYCALSDEGKVFCADAATGQIEWTTETGAVIYDSSFCATPPTYPGPKTVFIGNVNGTLNALDAATGKITWQYRLPPGHLLASPVADDKNVYISSMSGQLFALPISPPNIPSTPK